MLHHCFLIFHRFLRRTHCSDWTACCAQTDCFFILQRYACPLSVYIGIILIEISNETSKFSGNSNYFRNGLRVHSATIITSTGLESVYHGVFIDDAYCIPSRVMVLHFVSRMVLRSCYHGINLLNPWSKLNLEMTLIFNPNKYSFTFRRLSHCWYSLSE